MLYSILHSLLLLIYCNFIYPHFIFCIVVNYCFVNPFSAICSNYNTENNEYNVYKELKEGRGIKRIDFFAIF